MDELYDYDYCYECQGYGDDYYMDEHGEWVSACDDCTHNKTWRDGNGWVHREGSTNRCGRVYRLV